MAGKKTLGLILLIVGALAIGLLFEPVKTFLNIGKGVLEGRFGITDTILTTLGIVALIIGIFMLRRPGKAKQKAAEVPIYHGKQIVGYRKV